MRCRAPQTFRITTPLAVALSIWPLAISSARSAALEIPAEAVAAHRERLAYTGFRIMVKRQLRLARVSSAIRLHGAALCEPHVSPILGVVAASSNDLPRAFRDPAYLDFGVDDLVKVLGVVPEFPAAKAGVRIGDTILQIDGREIHSAAALDPQPTSATPSDTTTLRIERAGAIFDLELENQPGCFEPVELRILDNLDLRRDGARIVVYSGMLRFLQSDDELAVLLAHQFAHNLLGREDSTPTVESEADSLGLYMAARAGFDISVAADLLLRLAREFPLNLAERTGYKHPNSPERMLALKASMREVWTRLEAGRALDPRIP